MRIQSYMTQRGRCSTFGGPNDSGVKIDEGLAIVTPKAALGPIYRGLFIESLDVSKGLARQLNPNAHYCAMRWTSSMVARLSRTGAMVLVQSRLGRAIWCTPVDYGPANWTKRIIDLSPASMNAIGCKTDDEVIVEFYCSDEA